MEITITLFYYSNNKVENDILYYRIRTWEYIERNPCSPIYPNWYPGGKYRYHTKFYADKYRKTFLYEVYGGDW